MGQALKPQHGYFLQLGYSMVELVTVIVIVGLLSLMAAPSLLDRTALDSRSLYDQLISALRYAQKAALAQNRYVCVSFDASSNVTLTYTASAPTSAVCAGASLMSPGTESGYSLSPPDGVTISITDAGNSPVSLPASFSFSPQGRPLVYVSPSGLASLKQTFTVSGYVDPIIVEGETGYVY